MIRVSEEPLPLVTPNDVICTADQPASTVAEQVYIKILDLTGMALPAPPHEAVQPESLKQLELFPQQLPADGPSSDHEGGSPGKSAAVRALMIETLLHIHAFQVNTDRALGENLACGEPISHVDTERRTSAAGILALASVTRRVLDHD
ncbi:hypothetical protein [Streptomyces subrutilus]|uniref:hypothetical protein n=1 Tax=Streptomyces subrutilus TaxID=36818 RepID=UPI0033E405CB